MVWCWQTCSQHSLCLWMVMTDLFSVWMVRYWQTCSQHNEWMVRKSMVWYWQSRSLLPVYLWMVWYWQTCWLSPDYEWYDADRPVLCHQSVYEWYDADRPVLCHQSVYEWHDADRPVLCHQSMNGTILTDLFTTSLSMNGTILTDLFTTQWKNGLSMVWDWHTHSLSPVSPWMVWCWPTSSLSPVCPWRQLTCPLLTVTNLSVMLSASALSSPRDSTALKCSRILQSPTEYRE